MDLIIETDIGRDADDFFAICYLAAAKVNIKAITITPGDKDQVAVAKFLMKRFGFDNVKIGVPAERGKKSVTPFHTHILNYYGEPTSVEPDGIGGEIIAEAVEKSDLPNLFAIGPVTNVAAFLKTASNKIFKHATMQGGFCSYDIQCPTKCEKLIKFNGMMTCPTFNLNGDKKAGQIFIDDTRFKRRFVGKNVCHGIYWNKERYQTMYDRWEGNALEPINLMLMASKMYFSKHPEKKFHDPTAAVCMLHPEIGTYVKGKTYNEKGGWGTKLDNDGDDICTDLDETKLWEYLIRGE